MQSQPSVTDDEQLIDRMNAIRNSSERNVAAMHHEAGRLVDWREHVRAQPLVAVGAAMLLGYSIMHRGKPDRPTTQPAKTDSSVAAKTTIASGAMAFVGSLASNFARQYVSGYVKNQLAGVRNDSLPSSTTPQERNAFNR